MSELPNRNLFKDIESFATLSSLSMQALTISKYHDILQNLHKYPELLDVTNMLRRMQEINSHFELINKLLKNPLVVTDNITHILEQLKHLEKGFYKSELIVPKSIFDQNKDLFKRRIDLDYIKQIQDIISPIQKAQSAEANIANQKLQEVAEDIEKGKQPNYKTIILLITMLVTALGWAIENYSNLKEIYKDFTYDPITTICGTLTDLEKEAVKFVEVAHRGGIDIYQYPKGKKTVDFILNGTQLCMLTEPKGNAKRVKVIYQLENHKQITGYVDRKAIKRLYKVE